jgi:hypothetical protein
MSDFDTEFQKLKKIAEDGHIFFHGDDLDPHYPQVISNYIDTYHEAGNTPDEMSIRDYLGEPDFVPLDEISPDDIPNEIQKINHLLRSHFIIVDFNELVPLLERYQFLTTEFLDITIADMPRDGMSLIFDYQQCKTI